jgi:hypothetical protein
MRNLVIFLTATALAAWSFDSVAEDAVYNVVSPVPFAEDSGATGKVKAECTLETRLPQFIAEAAKRGVKVVIGPAPEEGADGKYLYLEFTHVMGAGGGAWSGPKSVTAKGELIENGEVIGSFISSRYSTGGAFGGYKGTCSILGRCIKAMGKDIAAWLKSPTMDAQLGDA